MYVGMCMCRCRCMCMCVHVCVSVCVCMCVCECVCACACVCVCIFFIEQFIPPTLPDVSFSDVRPRQVVLNLLSCHSVFRVFAWLR